MVTCGALVPMAVMGLAYCIVLVIAFNVVAKTMSFIAVLSIIFICD